jgi:hypothetical protein
VAADCVSWETLADAVRDVLVGVSGIGHVYPRPGGVPTWRKTAKPRQAYWEIDVSGSSEEHAGIGTNCFETVIVRLDGWMVFSTDPASESNSVWRALVKRVKDRLRTYATLANAIEGLTRSGHLPQVRVNERVDFADGQDHPLCHHVQIECRYVRYFTYSVSTSL